MRPPLRRLQRSSVNSSSRDTTDQQASPRPDRGHNHPPELIGPETTAPARAAVAARLEWVRARRLKQIIPSDGDWQVWLALAGRGWGKTRTGAEDAWWYCATNPGVRYAVVAPTHHDLRLVCFEGDSGILGVVPPLVLEGGKVDTGYNRSLLQIRFSNGSLIQGYSAEVPSRLRGPQHHRAWCDEVASWERLQDTWDMLGFTMRLGARPQVIITTTPKPVPLLYLMVKAIERTALREGRAGDEAERVPNLAAEPDPEVLALGNVLLATGSTFENQRNLARPFLAKMVSLRDTELGRQEIDAELLDLDARAILKRGWWRPWQEFGPDNQAAYPTELLMAFASIDTAFTEKKENDASACTVWHVYRDEHLKVRILLRYAWEERLEFPELVDRLKETCEHFGLRRVVIEAKASGKSVAQELRKQRPEVSVFEWVPVGDKLARAHAIAPVLREGLVRVGSEMTPIGPVPRSWARKVIEQCAEFTGAKEAHDDLVDSVTMGLQYIRRAGVALFKADEPSPAGPKRKRRLY
jgi:predicted phage terminase large subunit-like protein